MPKERYTLSLDRDVVAVVDKVCAELEMTRSDFIDIAMEQALDDWRFLRIFGMTPGRFKRVARALKRIKVFKSGDYEIVVPENLEERLKLDEEK